MTDRDRLKNMMEALLAWYPEHARDLPWRKDREPYHVWLSEIMLQQTRVEAVREYYARFLNALPDIPDLAEVDDDRLMKLWQGLGYYNRARNLKKAAEVICRDYDGSFPKEFEEIRNLPGIGDYTAGAIGSICFDLPTPAVDGNVLRVYARLLADSSNIDKASTKKTVKEALAAVYPREHAGMATQSLMELGACVCVPNGAPKCESCPLAHLCFSKKQGTWNDFPVREKKKKRRQEIKQVYVLLCEDKVAIVKRPEKGLLSGLWEFPNRDLPDVIENEKKKTQLAADTVTSYAAEPLRLMMYTEYTHIFTHVEWEMTAYYFECAHMPDVFTWVTRDELEADYALPSAFAPFVKKLPETGKL